VRSGKSFFLRVDVRRADAKHFVWSGGMEGRRNCQSLKALKNLLVVGRKNNPIPEVKPNRVNVL
jgi:hypothetical protein